MMPCSFKTHKDFTPQRLTWHKCRSDAKKCGNAVFNSDDNEHTTAKFKGRMSLLEPDVSQTNCSIMINDLKKSDSGSYQLRVEGGGDGFTYIKKTVLSVTGRKNLSITLHHILKYKTKHYCYYFY